MKPKKPNEPTVSGDVTNLKMGEHRSGTKVGGTDPARRKFFLVVPLHFLALKAQLVALVSAFVIISTV